MYYPQNAKSFSETAIGIALGHTDSIEKLHKESGSIFTSKKLPKRIFEDVFFEFLFFYIHYVDRQASSKLPKNKKDTLLKEIIDTSISLSTKAFHMETTQITLSGMIMKYKDKFDKRNTLYNSYDHIIPSTQEDRKGSLIWECSKIIADIVDEYRPLVYVTYINSILPAGLNELDVPHFVHSFL